MPRLALLTEDLTEVLKDHVTAEDLADTHPGLQLGTVMREESFAEYPRLTMILETTKPEAGYGEVVELGPPERGEDGIWRDTWDVVQPDLDQLKQRARNRANTAASEKISTLELALGLIQGDARPRTIQVVNKRAEVLDRIDAATTVEEVAAIIAELEAL